MNDLELLGELRSASRRCAGELADIEVAEPVDAASVDRAAARALQELATVRSGIGARRPMRTRVVVWAAIAAIAASVAIVSLHSMRSSPLPAYEVALLAGGARTERALGPNEHVGAGSPVPVAPGAELDLVARPATRVRGAVDGRAFLLHDGRVVPWTTTLEATPEGIVHIRAKLDPALLLGSGEWAVAIVVGAGALPNDPSDVAKAAEGGAGAAGPGGAWRVARLPLAAVSP